MKTKILTVFAVLGLGGCASVQIPQQKLEKSEASIRAAEEAGAQHIPKANIHLQQANYEKQSAQQMARDGEPRAEFTLDRSILEAQLSQAIAENVASEALLNGASRNLVVEPAKTAPKSGQRVTP